MIAVRQEVNNLESSVVVQELEFAINIFLTSVHVVFVRVCALIRQITVFDFAECFIIQQNGVSILWHMWYFEAGG